MTKKLNDLINLMKLNYPSKNYKWILKEIIKSKIPTLEMKVECEKKLETN